VIFPATAKVINGDYDSTAGIDFPLSALIPPVAGATAPVNADLTNDAYTATINWGTNTLVSGKFAANRVYTPSITLVPKTGYTLKGFRVALAFIGDSSNTSLNTTILGAVDESGTFTIQFAATDPNVTADLAVGITVPATGGTPATTITPATPGQYTAGTVTWSPTATTFAAGTVYTATVPLTVKTGFTFFGQAANSFTVSGATSATFAVDATDPTIGTLTVVFPATGS